MSATRLVDPCAATGGSGLLVFTLSMAALVKSVALQNTCHYTCNEMLRQHSLNQQKAALSALRRDDPQRTASMGRFCHVIWRDIRRICPFSLNKAS